MENDSYLWRAAKPCVSTMLRVVVLAAVLSAGVSAAVAQSQSGLAAIYSYRSGRTASGEISRPEKFTAAHRFLAFGTMVRVINRHNGRSVIVRINDRGPFTRGRVIDLTPAAAHELEFSGLTPVTLEVLGRN